MEQETKVEPVVEPVVAPTVEPVVAEVEKPVDRKTILRELSTEYGVNLFEADGLKKFKEYTESQKTEQEKLKEQLTTYETEKEQWQREKLEYKAKLKASELRIKPDALEDALKLAEGDPDKLADVLKKYPIFKSTEGVRIGVQEPNNFQAPTDNSEAEKYMAQNPLYKKYNSKK
jgi:hypothetical protein